MIIMRGLPASGKSTKAQEIVAQGNTVRINKDLLRTMLHFDSFSGVKEGITHDIAQTIAKRCLVSDKHNVVIDDTNLNPRTMQSWKDLAKECEAKVEIVDMKCSIEECVLRDSQREKMVGGTVIKNMALKYDMVPEPKGYILCDIDGTIADTTHRQHFVEKSPKDWKGFFGDISQDTVREDVRKMLIDWYNQMYTIIFVSGRPDNYKEETLTWLEKNNLTFAWTLIMRRESDKRPDTEVKLEILNQHFHNKSLIHAVIDDRPSVIRMWRENGLNVIDVGKGIDF